MLFGRLVIWFISSVVTFGCLPRQPLEIVMFLMLTWVVKERDWLVKVGQKAVRIYLLPNAIPVTEIKCEYISYIL